MAIPFGGTRLVFGPVWLIVIPLLLWGVQSYYVPVLAPSLGSTETWAATILIVIGAVAAVAAHACAHVLVASLTQARLPDRLPLYPTGDAAHVWPVSQSLWAEVLVSLAGVLTSLALGGLAYLIWDRQIGTFWNTVSLFFVFANLGGAIINLAPVFPHDGGRLIRALVGRSAGSAIAGKRLVFGLAWLTVGALGAWAAFLYLQQLRFSTETSAITLAAMLLIAFELAAEKPGRWPSSPPRRSFWGYFQAAAAFILLSPALVVLLPTNLGMEAPGPAASVEPMVSVEHGHAYPAEGTFILTTIIPQAPIVAGEWLYAQYDHGILIKPAKEIVRPGTSSQQLAVQAFRDLQESEKTAIVVGLNMAGFQASLTYTGARIVAIQPDSKAAGILMPGDDITAVAGQSVDLASDVARILSSMTPTPTSVTLGIHRGNQDLTLDVPLSPDASGEPRIGINVAPTGDRLDLPFQVDITPRKIEGGPSAGLMFALTVYNSVTPDDLTNGHRIAGTGTVDLNGQVGSIGGVHAKVAAAERAGAEYFLVPIDNYEDAAAAARHITVVPVASAGEALQFLKTLSPAN